MNPPDAAPPLHAPPLRRRIACMVYEGVLLFGVVFVAGYLFATLLQQRNGLMLRHALTLWIAVVVGVYFVWFWTHGGQTVAMKTWRIRLRDARGAPVSTPRAIGRYLAGWLAWLPPLALHPLLGLPLSVTLAVAAGWCALWLAAARLDPARQLPHDRLAGTRLVPA